MTTIAENQTFPDGEVIRTLVGCTATSPPNQKVIRNLSWDHIPSLPSQFLIRTYSDNTVPISTSQQEIRKLTAEILSAREGKISA